MRHKRSVLSIALATIMLVSLCAVCASTSASAAPSSNTNVQVPSLVGMSIVGGPCVSSWGPDGFNLMVFARGSDNALWSKSLDQIDSVWGHWTTMNGGITSAPAAVSWDDTHMQVYVRGTNGALYSRGTGDGAETWTPWYKPVEGQLLAGTGPGVCNAPGTITQELFVTGTNGNLYWSHWSVGTSYSAWHNLGGQLTSSPAAISYVLSTGTFIQVFGRGTNGALYSRQTGDGGQTWTPWYKPVEGQLIAGTGPAVCVLNIPGTQNLFVTGTNGVPYWSPYSEHGYLPFTPLGGKLTSSPSATAMDLGIQLWGRGTNGLLYFNGYYAYSPYSWSWSGWHVIPDNT